MDKVIEFWFDFASTYSYLTAMRIETVCKAKGVRIEWRPFLLGPLFKQQGWSTSPFNVYPVEGKYMWREMERHSRLLGLNQYKKPSSFPRNSLLAARIGVAAQGERWLGDFVRSTFQAEFEQDLDIGESSVMREILKSCGVDPEFWILKSQSEENKSALRARTEEAQRKEIFGAPSFVVHINGNNELFWGNDRLEEALIL